MEPIDDQGTPATRHLRLVWSNPAPPLPRRPIDLAVAIERHLSGHDGLSDAEFARVFARTRVAPDRTAVARSW